MLRLLGEPGCQKRGSEGKTPWGSLEPEVGDLGHERFHYVALVDLTDPLAAYEHHSAVAARCHAYVGLPGLPWAVDGASHDGDLDREPRARKTARHLFIVLQLPGRKQ